MKRIIIAALSANHGIGINNDLPWSLPDDMKFFKAKTLGKTVIMGRKNYESIPHKYRPLPKRENIIVTRQQDYKAEGCVVVNSIASGIDQANFSDEIYIIGGGQIYEEALKENLVDEMYLTRVEAEIDADVYFPQFDLKDWDIEIIEQHAADELHAYPFTIEHLVKK